MESRKIAPFVRQIVELRPKGRKLMDENRIRDPPVAETSLSRVVESTSDMGKLHIPKNA